MPALPNAKPSVVAATSLVLYDRVREALSVGEVNRNILRAAFPALSERQFGLAFHMARRAAEAEGYFLKPVRGRSGCYVPCTPEDVADKAMNKSRMAEVRAIRRRGDLLIHSQRHSGIDEESRQRLNAEEIVHSRFIQIAERMLLKSQRKRPDGLE